MYATPYPSPGQQPINIIVRSVRDTSRDLREVEVLYDGHDISRELAQGHGLFFYAASDGVERIDLYERGLALRLAELARAARQLNRTDGLTSLAEVTIQLLSPIGDEYSVYLVVGERHADVLQNRYGMTHTFYSYDGQLRQERVLFESIPEQLGTLDSVRGKWAGL